MIATASARVPDMSTKTEMQGFRTSKETKKELVRVAAHYGHLPGPFVACLVERFIADHNASEGVVWPPKFVCFNDLPYLPDGVEAKVARDAYKSELLFKGAIIPTQENLEKKAAGQQLGKRSKNKQ